MRCNRGSVALEAMVSFTMFIILGYVLVMAALCLELKEKVDQALFETALEFNQMMEIEDGLMNLALRQGRLDMAFTRNLVEKGVSREGALKGLKMIVMPQEDAREALLMASISFNLPVYGPMEVVSRYHAVNSGFAVKSSQRKVLLTKTGKKYHLEGCYTTRNSTGMEVVTEVEAWDSGYSPCKVCHGVTSFGKGRVNK